MNLCESLHSKVQVSHRLGYQQSHHFSGVDSGWQSWAACHLEMSKVCYLHSLIETDPLSGYHLSLAFAVNPATWLRAYRQLTEHLLSYCDG